ncbi:hypothetical protein [Nocardia sp. N2S4-5]|uniref:hypothetical protein n=1 Tax=Nocardia sp. N2S4-5 TaxID=3351565 RepID=UPI0037D70F79
MTTVEPHFIRTREDLAEEQRDREEVAEFASATILLGADPARPDELRAHVHVVPGGPTFADLADGLREIAAEFDHRHETGLFAGGES